MSASHSSSSRLEETEEQRDKRYKSIKKAREDALRSELKTVMRSFFIDALYSSGDDRFDTAFKVDRVGVAIHALEDLLQELKKSKGGDSYDGSDRP